MKTIIFRSLLLLVGFFWVPTLTAGVLVSLMELSPIMLAIFGAPLAIYSWFAADTVLKVRQRIKAVK